MEQQDPQSRQQLRLKTGQVGQCAWCSDPIRRDEYFTVTFPEKDQAIFHIECLYRYRELTSPQTSR